MRYEIDINGDYKEVSVLIKAPEMNEEVAGILARLEDDRKNQERHLADAGQKRPVHPSISGRIDQKIYVLSPEDISLFYTIKGKVFADSKNFTYEIRQKLYEVEDLLVGTSFIRISKSAIVNIHRIKNIEVTFNGSLVVKFSNGHEEIISRRFVSKVKEFIGLGGQPK